MAIRGGGYSLNMNAKDERPLRIYFGSVRHFSPFVFAFIATLVFAVVPLPGPANASNWAGATNLTGCNLNMTENSGVAIYGFSLSTPTANAVAWVRSNRLDPTDLTTSTPSSASNADIIVYDGYYTEICGETMYSAGGDYVGFANCTTKHTAGQYQGRCNVHEVFIDQKFVDDRGTTTERVLLCHELGHTLSLKHTSSTTSCMASLIGSVTSYSTHDIAHINSAY